MDRKKVSQYVLIAALVLVFGMFGIEKFTQPDNWIGWMPSWMEGLLGFPKTTWLSIVGASEISMAILVMIPLRRVQQIGATLMVLHLAGIISQIGWNDITIRDSGLLLAAISLLISL